MAKNDAMQFHQRLYRLTMRLTSRRSQPPLALSVPLSRFTPRVGGGSAFFVRLLDYAKSYRHFLADIGCGHFSICFHVDSVACPAFILFCLSDEVIGRASRFHVPNRQARQRPFVVYRSFVRCSLVRFASGSPTLSRQDDSVRHCEFVCSGACGLVSYVLLLIR